MKGLPLCLLLLNAEPSTGALNQTMYGTTGSIENQFPQLTPPDGF
tara:strand:- start:2418 stop:2552 length:135 start_codon:yes stop_codon:yes gene_type:complete